jgi:nucleoside-diphosphate-sugar epimerase
MTDRGRYWTGRRVLVLGCTGFLGGWAVRGLLARGAEVVGLVRDPNPESDFFRDKLYHQVHISRGRAEDATRLRTLIAVYEPQLVVQCAADPNGVADAFHYAAVAAAGSIPVVIPVHPNAVVHPRTSQDREHTITFVRVPLLFGMGDRRWDRWPPRLFQSVARGEPLSPPPPELVGAPVLHIRDAVNGLLDVINPPEQPVAGQAGVRSAALTPQGTAADLFAAVVRQTTVGPRLHDTADTPEGVKALDPAVAETIVWYRTAVGPAVRPEMSPPKAAA